MGRWMTAREYARSQIADKREATNLERRLQRYAADLPEDQREKVGRAYALTKAQWDALAAQERPVGRPKAEPQSP